MASGKNTLGGTVLGLLAEKQREKSIPNIPESEKIILNVGGVQHLTTFTTLLKKPDTRLYNVAVVAKKKGLKEVYFDRHPALFAHILNFYRTDSLHVPTDLCGPMLKDELKYWQLDENQIEQCCWVNYCHYEDTLEMLRKFEADHSLKFRGNYRAEDSSLWSRSRPKIWNWLQDPYSSKGALSYAIVSLCIVTCSITVFILETLPYFGSVTIHAKRKNITITSVDLRNDLDIFNDVSANDVLIIIDNTCNIFFFVEFVIKFLTAPSKLRFLREPLTVVELLCLIPYYIAITLIFTHGDPVQIFEFIRVLLASRVLRIFRIFVLMKHFLALKILVYTMRASAKELLLLVFIVMIGIIIFACLEYYMEMFTDVESDFEHIPLAFWWALITMTTVGYGDIYPKSGPGYIVGGLCAISGVLVIALSVPVIVNNFTVYYTHAQSRAKLKERRRRQNVANHWRKGMTMVRRNTIQQRILVNGKGPRVGVVLDLEDSINGQLPKSATNFPIPTPKPNNAVNDEDKSGAVTTRTLSNIPLIDTPDGIALSEVPLPGAVETAEDKLKRLFGCQTVSNTNGDAVTNLSDKKSAIDVLTPIE